MRGDSNRTAWVTALAGACLLASACSGGGSDRRLLQNKGSDTLVNVAQAWAENYRNVRPNVAIAVSGGGSGTGIAALVNGTVDIANASREIHADEQAQIKNARGVEAVEHVVARDAIVVYVHPSNPIERITFSELACIYGEGGQCDAWSSVGLEVPGCAGQTIIRVSRQSNSGTYEYFREAVLGKETDFKLGSRDMQGSKDVVDLVSNTPCAIGYSGMGYATAGVKAICVAHEKTGACVKPEPATAADGSYPLSRDLYMYTLGEPTNEIKAYLDWIRSAEGQKIVVQSGFVAIS